MEEVVLCAFRLVNGRCLSVCIRDSTLLTYSASLHAIVSSVFFAEGKSDYRCVSMFLRGFRRWDAERVAAAPELHGRRWRVILCTAHLRLVVDFVRTIFLRLTYESCCRGGGESSLDARQERLRN